MTKYLLSGAIRGSPAVVIAIVAQAEAAVSLNYHARNAFAFAAHHSSQQNTDASGS